MKTLHPEILSCIFREAVLTSQGDLDLRSASVDKVVDANRESLRTALSISQVCHSWRDDALDDASLWSHFVIIGQSPPTTRSIPEDLLARTRNVPLNYTVILKHQKHLERDAAIVDLLITQQNRWENVSFGWEVLAGHPRDPLDEYADVDLTRSQPAQRRLYAR